MPLLDLLLGAEILLEQVSRAKSLPPGVFCRRRDGDGLQLHAE
jgi:hypothetical protein